MMVIVIEGEAYSWNQSICNDCWFLKYHNKIPVKIKEDFVEEEQCAYCGVNNKSGIYVRDDPRSVPYPRKDEVWAGE